MSVDKLEQIFFPSASRRYKEIRKSKKRFVYYTTAETARKILLDKEIWMRNATTMNDFSEVEYGIRCLRFALQSENGRSFSAVLDRWLPGSYETLVKRFDSWLPSMRLDTYLACVSEHHDSEDKYGRLSMWRAYGGDAGVALVLNSGAFVGESDALHAYSSPVEYVSELEFSTRLQELTNGMSQNAALISTYDKEMVLDRIFAAFRFAVLSTKHPGFLEEREWRVIYSPSFLNSPRIRREIEVVRGIPQTVCKIPLADIPEEGLVGLSMPSLVDRIIIGPSLYPMMLGRAFQELLTNAGVPDAGNRIFLSDIPLRRA